MQNGRVDFEIVDSIESAPVAIERYDLVDVNGNKVTDSTDTADIFGFAKDGAEVGAPFAVCRRGFCPVKQSDGETVSRGDLLVPSSTAGEVVVIPASGGGTGHVVARAEQDSNGDGVQTGAYVDCLALNVDVTIPA